MKIRRIIYAFPALALACSPLCSHAQESLTPPFETENPKPQNLTTAFLTKVSQFAVASGEYQLCADYLSKQLIFNLRRELRQLKTDRAEELALAVANWKAFNAMNQARVAANDPTAVWILSDPERFRQFGETIDLEADRPSRVWEIITELAGSVPQFRDKYSHLILAMALVWDAPNLTVHRQMGPYQENKQEKLVHRLQYFIKIYESRQAKANYKDLNLQELMCVVDTPISLREMQWALKKVGGNRKNWGKNYQRIDYDHDRLDEEIFTWPDSQGPYTLENIEKLGGICVDQAYYCTLSARANGIPALYFSGEGRRGGHAWSGIYTKTDEWDLNIGRYSQDNYATGTARDPQTGAELMDYQVSFAYDRRFRRGAYETARHKVTLADFLLSVDEKKMALFIAQDLTKRTPLFEQGWDILEQFYTETKQRPALLKLLESKMKAFRDFPEVEAKACSALADLYIQKGDQIKAERLVDGMIKELARDRFDLSIKMGIERFHSLAKQRDPRPAFKYALDFFDDHIKEGTMLSEFLMAFVETSMQNPKLLTNNNKQLYKVFKDLLKQDLYPKDAYRVAYIIKPAFERDTDPRLLNYLQRDLEKATKK